MNQYQSIEKPLKTSLFLLRAGVFIVFFMWTLDKFINPGHTAAVFANFFYFDGVTTGLAYALGAVQAVLVFAFLLGVKKQYTYGALFVMHLASTLVSFGRYLDPWSNPNLLFFAAWPMLAALAALYLLREEDTLFTFKKAE